MLIDPAKTMTWTDGAPAGRYRFVAQDLKRDQWKNGGGTTWGWYSDKALNLMFYGTGNLRHGTCRSVRATTDGR
jgi:glucose dehydrogenase